MRDLIASHAPLRGGRHKARQYGPKHYPWGFKGPQPLGTPFSPIFRRATKDGVPEGRSFRTAVRKMGRKKGSPCTHALPFVPFSCSHHTTFSFHCLPLFFHFAEIFKKFEPDIS